MHPRNPGHVAFKRQVVFRISPEEWPLLEAAAAEHGSIQAAILAGLRALAQEHTAPEDEKPKSATAGEDEPGSEQAAGAPLGEDPSEEIGARHAAAILGLKSSTVSGYIRSGRLPGHYSNTLGASGWVTTRAAVLAYQRRVRSRRR